MLKKGQPKVPGSGRVKGTPNKTSAALRDMILMALSSAGGVAYLERQAEANPGPFLALVGKVLPLQMVGDASAPIPHTITFIVREAEGAKNRT